MAKGNSSIPPDWQKKVFEALKAYHSQGKGPAWGISLPESWKGHLVPYAVDGQLKHIFKVKSVIFKGKEPRAFGEPAPEKSEE